MSVLLGAGVVLEHQAGDGGHRLHAHHAAHVQVEAFDRVLFVEEGRLIMDGSPAVLTVENERYAKLLAFDRGLSF